MSIPYPGTPGGGMGPNPFPDLARPDSFGGLNLPALINSEGVFVQSDKDVLFMDQVEILTNAYVYGSLHVGGDFEILGSLHIQGDLDVDGNMTVGGTLDVDDDVEFGSNLEIIEDLHVGGTVIVDEDILVENDVDILGDLTVGGLSIFDDVIINGTLDVTGIV